MNKLLIVDDSGPVRDIIRRTVRLSGVSVCTILEAASGTEALKCLQEHPDLSLVLADLGMPGMGGVELVEKLRRERSSAQLTVVALSVLGQESQEQEALACGADDRLRKPFSPADLGALLCRYAA